MAGSFSELVIIQVCSYNTSVWFLFSTVFLLCPSECLGFYNEIMWTFWQEENNQTKI